MANLEKALDMLNILRHNSDDFWAVLHDAEYTIEEIDEVLQATTQAELLELQRLQSTVKEFIAHEGFQCRDDIYEACEEYNCPVDFIESLCNIVGYSE